MREDHIINLSLAVQGCHRESWRGVCWRTVIRLSHHGRQFPGWLLDFSKVAVGWVCLGEHIVHVPVPKKKVENHHF